MFNVSLHRSGHIARHTVGRVDSPDTAAAERRRKTKTFKNLLADGVQVEAAKKELDMPDLGNKVRNKSVEKVLEGLLIARDEVPDADPVKVSCRCWALS